MYQEDHATGSAQFATAGAAADPGGLIRFLDAARTLPALRTAKQALLAQLALGRARSALDVGCGIGGNLAEMARLMPDGTQVSGLDASETMIAEARRRTASLGTRVSLRVGDAADLPYPDRLQSQALLTGQQTSQWCAELETWVQAGDFLGARHVRGSATFLYRERPQQLSHGGTWELLRPLRGAVS